MNDKLDIQSTSNDFTYELDSEKNELNYELDNLYVFDISKYQKEELDINATTEKQTFIPRDGYLYDKVIVNAVDNTIDSNIKADNIRKGVSILGVDGIIEKLPYQEKTIEPTTSEQVITADTGYDLSSVTIRPVTSDIDENIKPENIKKDVNVLGVTGTMEEKPIEALQKVIDGKTSCYYLFYGYQGTNLDYISGLDTSHISDMDKMFYNCTKLTTIPQLDTSSAANMANMFYQCNSLTSISYLDTSKVTNMVNMFNSCYKLKTIQQLNLIKKPTTTYIFSYCKALENLTLKNIQKTIQIGSDTSWGHLLTLDSLLNTIKELWDMSSSSSQTLTVGSANLTKLANVYVKLIDITDEMRAEDTYIDKKKPFVVCESTDNGAMLITDYARTLKNWNIN